VSIANVAPAPVHYDWPALTGLRGLAAFAVVCLHTFSLSGNPSSLPSPLTWLFSMGGAGVDVFFTLSAFLLTLPFVASEFESEPTPNLRVYAKRRLLRILPAYYVQIAILLALGALGANSAWAWTMPKLSAVIAHLLFYLDAWPLVFPQIPPWWTLPVEMGFYLLLPLFARCLRPRRWPWLLLGIAASLAYRYGLTQTGLTMARQINWGDHLPGRLHQFLIGMLAAYAFVRLKMVKRLPSGRLADGLTLMAIVMFIALPALGYPIVGRTFLGEPSPNLVLQGWHLYASLLVALLLVTLAAGAPIFGRVFSWPPLRGLGLISYSLYLWHYPVMLAVRDALGGFDKARGDFWTYFFYCVLFSVLVALASWWMVEQPAQRWGRRLSAVGKGG
jgi:peptidoglycan/LPS O-acetylase OafA/YrhL